MHIPVVLTLSMIKILALRQRSGSVGMRAPLVERLYRDGKWKQFLGHAQLTLPRYYILHL